MVTGHYDGSVRLSPVSTQQVCFCFLSFYFVFVFVFFIFFFFFFMTIKPGDE